MTPECCEEQPIPGCASDAECESCICTADPFCCDTQWDSLCAEAAQDGPCALTCGCVTLPPAASDCCMPSPSPGCSDPNCNAVICDLDPFCCDTEWDQICVDQALETCVVCSFL